MHFQILFEQRLVNLRINLTFAAHYRPQYLKELLRRLQTASLNLKLYVMYEDVQKLGLYFRQVLLMYSLITVIRDREI